ncbi:sensor histidine kinase [Lysobacter niabensis]|uniref:sensor histidine kinase n=1 Tax=Agrilutibacter niabensis TaxID=380628 RepID=UPI00360BADD6
MTANIVLLPVLAAVFAMAGIHHVLVWVRNSEAREHLWFGATSLLTAAAVAIHGVPWAAGSAPAVVQHLHVFLAVGWLIAATWFVVEYAPGGHQQRRAALVATLLLVAVFAGELAPLNKTLQGLLRLLAAIPVAVLLCLIFNGTQHLWYSARRARAVSLGTLGIVVCLLALQGAQSTAGAMRLSEPSLYVFLFVLLAMAYELAGAMTDVEAVSERQRQELAHASRLSIVGELTASIAHQINQPLGAILSNADAGEILLERNDPPLDEIRKVLGEIRRDGLRARDVIRHVRDLVKNKNRELEPERIDANFFITDVIALLESEASRRQFFFVTELSPRPLHVYADRTLLEQVHINLILNAMDAVEALDTDMQASPARPPIVVGVSSTPHGEIEFRISDAGKGIPKELLDHLFDSFYTSKPHGMGLGLSIARSIVEVHGGRIRAENNRRGGATFRVTLPPYEEQAG